MKSFLIYIMTPIFFGAVASWVYAEYQLRRLKKQYAKQEADDLWGNGEQMFAEEWVLTLCIRRPQNITIPVGGSMYNLYQYLEDYAQRAKTAVEFFPERRYLIGCDGSMRWLGDEAAAKLLGYPQVKAEIDFNELPRAENIAHRLAHDKPEDILQKARNCVLLNVHAHGMMQKDDGTESDRMPRFASRDGNIIVESC